MAEQAKPEVVVSVENARHFVGAALTALNLPAAQAERAAALIVSADQGGWSGHGVARLARYVDLLKRGQINPAAKVSTLRDAAATALLSGNNGMGHLSLSAAMDLAIAKAQEFGIGWVGVRDSNHAGAMAIYARRALPHGLLAICGSIASTNHMAPWGGVEPLLGSNPLCIAVPAANEPPFIFDMSTTIVSQGRIAGTTARGEKLPDGWMIDSDGNPLSDATSGGTILPAAGAKGYGLALSIALLAGVLNGATVGRRAARPNDLQPQPPNAGHFAVAIRVSAFLDPQTFGLAVDDLLTTLRTSRGRAGWPPIRIPGDQINQRIRESETVGLRLPSRMVANMDHLAADLGIPPLAR